MRRLLHALSFEFARKHLETFDFKIGELFLCINKGGGGDTTLNIVKNGIGLGRAEKVGQCRSLESSTHKSVSGWKFHNLALYTIDTYISNISYTLRNPLSCFAVTFLVYTLMVVGI